jgi:hypothetical protein
MVRKQMASVAVHGHTLLRATNEAGQELMGECGFERYGPNERCCKSGTHAPHLRKLQSCVCVNLFVTRRTHTHAHLFTVMYARACTQTNDTKILFR